MTTITAPHAPMTMLNTDGYEQTDIDRLNGVYVEAWNFLFGDEPADSDKDHNRAHSLWDAIGNTDGQLTLVIDRLSR